jgi:ABC-type multidrug transport system ATPase subunit
LEESHDGPAPALAVELRGLKKRYHGDVVAVDGVDVETEEGEYLVLLGPSGCGKTTLLRTIAGLERGLRESRPSMPSSSAAQRALRVRSSLGIFSALSGKAMFCSTDLCGYSA